MQLSEMITLEVQYGVAPHPTLPTYVQFLSWAKALYAVLPSNIAALQLSIRLVDAKEGQQLNQSFRHKNYPTNVLSFPYQQHPFIWGDLAICVPVVAKEAQAQNKPLVHHYAHLSLHGMLHLYGYDHVEEPAAEHMEALEIAALKILAIPNPY